MDRLICHIQAARVLKVCDYGSQREKVGVAFKTSVSRRLDSWGKEDELCLEEILGRHIIKD